MKKKIQPDPDYVDIRADFADDAETYTNKIVGKTHGLKTSDEWAAEWNKVFFEKVDELIKSFYHQCQSEWIVGSEACRQYLKLGSWKSAKRWIKRYNAPLRRWIDGKPVFLKSEIDEWLIKTGNDIKLKYK